MGLYGVTDCPGFGNFYSFPFVTAAVVIPALLAALLGYLFVTASGRLFFDSDPSCNDCVFQLLQRSELFNGTNGLTDFKTLLGQQ